MKKTALEKIVAYLRNRKTGGTVPEIARYANVNRNTARKLLGLHAGFDGFIKKQQKCRITGKRLTAYKLAAYPNSCTTQ